MEQQPARDVRLLQPTQVAFNVEGLPVPVTTSVDEEGRQSGEIRRRVLFLSAIIAVYIVVDALVQYAFDAAAIETALGQIRAVTNFKGGPTLAVLLMRSIPSVTTSIAIGLLVPLCGYVGARQNSQGLMGCFCGCNALHCCCGLISLVSMMVFVAMLSAATPGIKDYLELCDPVKCAVMSESMSRQERKERVVDCLAAGTWAGYHKRFDGPSYPPVCPKIMLKCNDDPDEDDLLPQPEEEDLQEVRPEWFGEATPLDTHGQLNQPGGWEELQSGGLLPESEPTPFNELKRRLGINFDVDPEAPTMVKHSRSWRTLPKWDDSSLTHGVGPMPEDPIATCKLHEKGMKLIHQARLLVPELVPKLVIFISVKLLLLIPVILLGCLGFFWGLDLYNRFGQGYGRLDGLTAPPQPQDVMLAATNLQVPLQATAPVVLADPVVATVQPQADGASPVEANAQE